MGKIDLRWVEEDRLGVEVQVGAVIVHQRDRLRPTEWRTLVMTADEVRGLAHVLGCCHCNAKDAPHDTTGGPMCSDCLSMCVD